MNAFGTVPAAFARSVEALLASALGAPTRVTSASSVGGGCVNTCARLETDRGTFFLKWNERAPRKMFEAEADGLAALRKAGEPHGLRVPEVIGVGSEWLLLEHVHRGKGGRAYGETLGRALAGLHGRGALDRSRAGSVDPVANSSATYGWHRDNFIGPLPQANPRTESWADFWRNERLVPQIALARERERLAGEDGRALEKLLASTADALQGAELDRPSLLHGDLWSGNVYPSENDEPVLIDPAVYIGHREVDIAMSELFGGFPTGFLDAYREAAPLHDDYRRVRRPLYQLYYLLVHVNLFGESYLSGVREAVKGVLRAV